MLLSKEKNHYALFISFTSILSILDVILCRNCIEKSQAAVLPKGLKAIPVVLTITSLGSAVKLPCNYCNIRPGIEGRVWRKRDLRGNETEVVLDMHDDETRNRVFKDKDHSLIIREVTEGDLAYYFCYSTEEQDGQPKMDILLDVGYRTKLEPHVLKVPVDLKKEVPKLLKSCEQIKRVPALSAYECYSEWGPWSKCDKCGKVGKRRRVGECRLQKLAKTKLETPEGKTVEADFPIVGVGCHSLLLNTIPKAKKILDDIPNIVLVENCEVSCENYIAQPTEMTVFRKSSFLKKIKVKVAKFSKGVAPAIVSEVKEENEGALLTLFCPGASLDTRVEWKFAGRTLKPDKLREKTAGRMSIDATDALHIRDLRPTDAGEYACTLYEVEIGLVRLKVISKHKAFDPTSHFGVLTISMLISFLLWLLLLAIKWKAFAVQRKVQRMRRLRGGCETGDASGGETESSALLQSPEENEEV